MNRFSRMLTVTGVGVLAGVTFGAGPAMASIGAAAQQGGDRDRFVRHFSDPRSCVNAGRIGEKLGNWDDFDCDRVGRHTWALEVERDDDGFPFGGGHRFHGDGGFRVSVHHSGFRIRGDRDDFGDRGDFGDRDDFGLGDRDRDFDDDVDGDFDGDDMDLRGGDRDRDDPDADADATADADCTCADDKPVKADKPVKVKGNKPVKNKPVKSHEPVKDDDTKADADGDKGYNKDRNKDREPVKDDAGDEDDMGDEGDE